MKRSSRTRTAEEWHDLLREVEAKARADERERIAQAIEAHHHPIDELCCFDDSRHGTLVLAAQIARDRGRDE